MNEHKELIKAWADGASIQWFNGENWIDLDNPRWVRGYEYRIKPEEFKWQKEKDHWEKGGKIQYRNLETGIWNDFRHNVDSIWKPDWKQSEWRIKPEIEYSFNDEVKESIEDILDCFDFSRVSKVMAALEWTWWNTDGVPEIWDLRKTARERLKSAVKGLISSGEKRYYSNCGGFHAEAETVEGNPKIYLTLKFVVSDWDNYEND